VQAAADVHETLFRKLTLAPAGLGVVWSCQVLPFQRSANVASMPVVPTCCPTAMHPVDPEHEIDHNSPLGIWGAGTDCVAQLAA